MTRPLSRIRRTANRRTGIFRESARWRRWRIAGWIAACFALVAVLATLQFEWIGEVSSSQLRASRANLRAPMFGAIDRFREEIRLLLWTFRPDADIDPADRLGRYWESYVSWHALSNHGLAIRRILFYDTFPDGRREFTELVGQPPRLKPAAWSEDLAPARRHIDDFGMRAGRSIGRRWAVTWMFHPRALALYRPIIRQDPQTVERSPNGELTGYLVLQLDLDFIRNQLIAEILENEFRRLSIGHRYVASVALDGKSLFIYDPVGPADATPEDSPARFEGYLLRRSGGAAQPYEMGVPDYEIAFPLSAEKLSQSMKRRRAVQRVALRSGLEAAQLRGPDRVPLGMEIEGNLPRRRRSEGQNLSGGWSRDLPRLVLVDDAPHRLSLRTKRVGRSILDAVNHGYRRSVGIGIFVLVLLVGAMAMVAMTARSAARLAAMRVEVAASQSHQLRNPLAGISLLADNMVRGALGNEEKVITYGEKMRDYGRQLNELVNRTVQLVAMDSPLRRYHLSMIDASTVAREALEQARPAIDDAEFRVECSCPEGLPPVRADREALRQCLGELLANAVKYGLPGRWVRIETEEAGCGRRREVRIRVIDRGPGIAIREARMIFEPFYRGRTVTPSSIPGSGLGLTLARSTLEGMGGRLTLKSQPGKGSVFSIHFSVA